VAGLVSQCPCQSRHKWNRGDLEVDLQRGAELDRDGRSSDAFSDEARSISAEWSHRFRFDCNANEKDLQKDQPGVEVTHGESAGLLLHSLALRVFIQPHCQKPSSVLSDLYRPLDLIVAIVSLFEPLGPEWILLIGEEAEK